MKQEYHNYCFHSIFLKTGYKHVKLLLNVRKMGKIVMISDDYHDIVRLLLLTIIVSSKNEMILIIVEENITVNRFYIDHHPINSCVALCIATYIFLL